MLYSIVGIIAVILDQIVKYWVAKNLFGTDIVIFIPKVISLVNVHNDGAAFSFLSGANARIPFIIITVIFLILVIIALVTNFISGSLSRWCMVMIAAGGLGNCIDRVINGYVQDMFKVELFNFPVFNLADVYITVFAIIFVFAMIFERQPEDEPVEEEEELPEVKPARRRAVKERASFREEERKPLLGRKKALDEDDEDYDEEPAPARRVSAAAEDVPAGRKATPRKKVHYEEEYARYKAQREAREKLSPRPAVQPKPIDKDDPFAEWDRANARRAAEEDSGDVQLEIDFGQGSEKDYSAPAAKAAPVPPAPAAPAKPAKAAEEFDLDDILAEFK